MQRQVLALIVCPSNTTIAVIDDPTAIKVYYAEEDRGRATDRRRLVIAKTDQRPDHEEEEIKWGTGTLPVLRSLHSSFSFQQRDHSDTIFMLHFGLQFLSMMTNSLSVAERRLTSLTKIPAVLLATGK